MDDLFRFMSVRPTQRAEAHTPVEPILAYLAGAPTPLHLELAKLRKVGADRAAMRARAEAHVASESYVGDLVALTHPFAELAAALREAGRRLGAPAALALARRTFGERLDEVVGADTFGLDRQRLADAQLANAVLGRADRADDTTAGLRIAALLEYLAATGESALQDAIVAQLLDASILLPADVFPLPEGARDERHEQRKAHKKERDRIGRIRKARAELTAKLRRAETAAGELKEAFAFEIAQRVAAAPVEVAAAPVRPPSDASGATLARDVDSLAIVNAVTAVRTLPLSPAAVERLSDDTRALLRERGFSADAIDVPSVMAALERDNARVAHDLFRDYGGGNAGPIGGTMVDLGDFGKLHVPDVGGTRVPGACAPDEPDEPVVASPTVPQGIGEARPLGIADLMVVRQSIKRYQAGEVAHIENVLRGETKERTHRRAKAIQVSTVRETEDVEEVERDLQTAERFELQLESQRTLIEETSKEAGLTISASYGPFVDATATAGFTSTSAREQSFRTATSYSRDVTERAASRVQRRVREEVIRTTIEEMEETNLHRFDNSGAGDHAVGIYRWIDKVYDAVVVNYGRRMMVEFVVPEPAALFRHVHSTKPVEGVTVDRPEPPGYCVNSNDFVPLSPRDINRTSYLYWVSKYKVPGASPPPPEFKTVATAFHEPFTSEDPQALAISSKELDVPDGYVAKEAWFSGNHGHYRYPENSERQAELLVYVGRQQLNPYHALNDEDGSIPIALVARYVLVFAITVEVRCELTREAFEAWQLETFTAIMTAYAEQKAAYEDQLREATADDGFAIRGSNPAMNRTVERTELKRAALEALTGQHFDLFDAMRRGVPPHGYPQADVAEADAEGRYIQFLEQAFEWLHMTYLFYPYFWARKSEWPSLLGLDDPDPLFQKFLHAGAARIQVPVRPGYNDVVLSFFGTGGEIWDGQDPPQLDDPLYRSIATELKYENGAAFEKTDGVLAVQHGQPEVTGTGTDFSEDDVDREVRIAGTVYRIVAVGSPQHATLDRPYTGETADGVRYAIGPKLVGEPWEIKVPTSLVYLQEDAELPVFETDGSTD